MASSACSASRFPDAQAWCNQVVIVAAPMPRHDGKRWMVAYAEDVVAAAGKGATIAISHA